MINHPNIRSLHHSSSVLFTILFTILLIPLDCFLQSVCPSNIFPVASCRTSSPTDPSRAPPSPRESVCRFSRPNSEDFSDFGVRWRGESRELLHGFYIIAVKNTHSTRDDCMAAVFGENFSTGLIFFLFFLCVISSRAQTITVQMWNLNIIF